MESPFILIAKLEEELKSKDKIEVKKEELLYLLKCAKAHLMKNVS